MTEYVAEARLENAYEYANSKLTLNPTTGGRSDERFEWSGMEENENLYVCVCVCVCVWASACFLWSYEELMFANIYFLVYGIFIFGLPMLFGHWNSFVLAFGAVEKDSIFGDLGGN